MALTHGTASASSEQHAGARGGPRWPLLPVPTSSRPFSSTDSNYTPWLCSALPPCLGSLPSSLCWQRPHYCPRLGSAPTGSGGAFRLPRADWGAPAPQTCLRRGPHLSQLCYRAATVSSADHGPDGVGTPAFPPPIPNRAGCPRTADTGCVPRGDEWVVPDVNVRAQAHGCTPMSCERVQTWPDPSELAPGHPVNERHVAVSSVHLSRVSPERRARRIRWARGRWQLV